MYILIIIIKISPLYCDYKDYIIISHLEEKNCIKQEKHFPFSYIFSFSFARQDEKNHQPWQSGVGVGRAAVYRARQRKSKNIRCPEQIEKNNKENGKLKTKEYHSTRYNTQAATYTRHPTHSQRHQMDGWWAGWRKETAEGKIKESIILLF